MSKLADYGIVLMTYTARDAEGQVQTARELAELSEIPLPTVSKLLKALARGGLLTSHRGTRGGYSLAREPTRISVADIISAIEGPPALTQCTEKASEPCDLEGCCPLRTNWAIINRTVVQALGALSLSEIAAPMKQMENRLASSERGLSIVEGTGP